MTTLELVPLRSMYPNSGFMTLRHAVPAIAVTTSPEDVLLEELQDILDSFDTTTTPQVVSASAGETAARKGGQAR